ncbi:hypothetical protein C5167_025647 [Papaver somniferum]|uniref:RING-type E3 ubiquitin transferase n=1 Tax=Papaver somniferum TaxID=3469 RepID=A0A4Y7JTL6_PAPSO|nr:hypothetical protein C5167_025647 [Papaver somniferum]
MNNNGGTTTISASEQAELCKKDGNFKFSKERFAAAIEAYTEAITLCPDVPVYWTNRALCHRKREEWGRAEEDCRKALELDSNSTKMQPVGLFVRLNHTTISLGIDVYGCWLIL